MSDARANILGRLRAEKPEFPASTEPTQILAPAWDTRGRVEQFRARMESVRAEVHLVSEESWPELLKEVVREKQLSSLLYASEGPLGAALAGAWEESDSSPLISRTDAIAEWKEDLFFKVEGAVTSTRWGIAETGTLVLWPTPEEPRSYSLVPPVHIAILDADNLYNTFAELVEKEQWQRGMPTNVLLISGPSKTADIEQTLAYGVHGPTELIVIVITEDDFIPSPFEGEG